MHPVQLFHWHFMAYPYLPPDFDERYDTGWVTVPKQPVGPRADRRALPGVYRPARSRRPELGFDGLVLNEHHQNIYGLMPSPNIIAAALTQRTERAKLVVLGNLLPLHLNPLRVAEEYAMIDSISGGRLIAGFAVGGGPEAYNYNIPSPQSRQRFWESIDLILRAWTEDGPFEHEGPSYPLRYVNIWPKPRQVPHPKVWIPAASAPRRWTMWRSAASTTSCRPAPTARRPGRRASASRRNPGAQRRRLQPVPHGGAAVGLCRRDRRAGQGGGGGGGLVLPQILPQGASAADRADAHLRPGRAVAVGVGRGGPIWRTRPPARRCWATPRIAGRSSRIEGLDRRRQPRHGAREAVGPDRAGRGREPADPVPFRQHGRTRSHGRARGCSRGGGAGAARALGRSVRPQVPDAGRYARPRAPPNERARGRPAAGAHGRGRRGGRGSRRSSTCTGSPTSTAPRSAGCRSTRRWPERFALIAPAHPGCAESSEDEDARDRRRPRLPLSRAVRRAGAGNAEASPAPASVAGSRPRSRCAIRSASSARADWSARPGCSSPARRSPMCSGRPTPPTGSRSPGSARCCSATANPGPRARNVPRPAAATSTGRCCATSCSASPPGSASARPICTTAVSPGGSGATGSRRWRSRARTTGWCRAATARSMPKGSATPGWRSSKGPGTAPSPSAPSAVAALVADFLAAP